MKPKYFIRVEKGGTYMDDSPVETWHGPFEVMPKNKLKDLLKHDPNMAYDYTVYETQVVPVEWDRL